MQHDEIERLRNTLQRTGEKYLELSSQLDRGLGIPLNRDDRQLIRIAVMREIMIDISITMTEWATIGGDLPRLDIPSHYKHLG